MRSLRRVLGDRLSGGVTAALAGYFLLLQAFVAAFTLGTTIPVETAPLLVLCQPSQMDAAANPSVDGEPAPFCHECPSGICGGSDADLTVVIAPGADLGLAYALLDPAPVALAQKTDAPIGPPVLGLAPGPRGPPRLSV